MYVVWGEGWREADVQLAMPILLPHQNLCNPCQKIVRKTPHHPHAYNTPATAIFDTYVMQYSGNQSEVKHMTFNFSIYLIEVLIRKGTFC